MSDGWPHFLGVVSPASGASRGFGGRLSEPPKGGLDRGLAATKSRPEGAERAAGERLNRRVSRGGGVW